jgi:integrase
MKNRKEFRVPSSAGAIEILKSLPRRSDSDYVLTVDGSPMSRNTLLHVLTTLDCGEFTTLGFRTSVRCWCADNGVPRDIAEAILAHTIGDATEAAYNRSDLLKRRAVVMQQWDDHCFGRTPADENVISIAERKRAS